MSWGLLSRHCGLTLIRVQCIRNLENAAPSVFASAARAAPVGPGKPCAVTCLRRSCDGEFLDSKLGLLTRGRARGAEVLWHARHVARRDLSTSTDLDGTPTSVSVCLSVGRATAPASLLIHCWFSRVATSQAQTLCHKSGPLKRHGSLGLLSVEGIQWHLFSGLIQTQNLELGGRQPRAKASLLKTPFRCRGVPKNKEKQVPHVRAFFRVFRLR